MTISILILVILLVLFTNGLQRFNSLIKAIQTTRRQMKKTMAQASFYIDSLKDDITIDTHELTRIKDCFEEINTSPSYRLPIIYHQLFDRLDYLIAQEPENEKYKRLDALIQPLNDLKNRYNGYIHYYNACLVQFPYSTIAKLMHLTPMQPIEYQPEDNR